MKLRKIGFLSKLSTNKKYSFPQKEKKWNGKIDEAFLSTLVLLYLIFLFLIQYSQFGSFYWVASYPNNLIQYYSFLPEYISYEVENEITCPVVF